MPSQKKYNEVTNKWEVIGTSQASELSILDLQDNFVGNNVESVMRELAELGNSAKSEAIGIKNALADVSSLVNNIDATFKDHLENHPGGSGGPGTGGGVLSHLHLRAV